MATQAANSRTVNGFDTTTLSGLVEVLEEHPEGGRVTFRSKSSLQDGARVFNSVKGYAIDGEAHHEGERSFVVLVDEPAEFGATDAASAPPEHLLYAVGSCIAATANAYAALEGVRLTRIEVALEGDLDLHGMFGLDDGVRPGLGELRATITIAGDANEATLRKLARLGYDYSLVRDSVEHGVRFTPDVIVAD